jgi:glycogen synthase
MEDREKPSVSAFKKSETGFSSETGTFRVAMAAWEIGRAATGLGSKVGGLGVVVEELPPALCEAAARKGLPLEVVTLSPCFAYHDRRKMVPLDIHLPVTLDGQTFHFEAYEYVFSDGQKVVYFWDEWQLNWTTPSSIYPFDSHMACRLYAAVCQAMAGYIRQENFQTVHLHDYHVGLIPFYLGDSYLEKTPIHFTIHNASYQGITPLIDGGYQALDRLGLPGQRLFHKYFDFFDNLNLMKACVLKVHETGGKITTVSGDMAATWGYAAELKESHATLWARAYGQKGSPPGQVFVPNRHLDLLEKLPIGGITNGMSGRNRADQIPELQAQILTEIQQKRSADNPLFQHPVTQARMLARDHTFDSNHLHEKWELKRLLHLEAFGFEPSDDPILITIVGRLVEQKNLGLAASILEWVLRFDGGVKFIILASGPEGDPYQKAIEADFFRLASWYPDRVYFNNTFNLPLSKLILAGGDFTLIPSRFEPCGLVDYEASLLGNIVIGRATGGLSKVSHCAYLYDWLDISDWYGEAHAFFRCIEDAILTYRHDPDRHVAMIRAAMAIKADWSESASQYVDMYRYGYMVKEWQKKRNGLVEDFAGSLDENRSMFDTFFIPASGEYGDASDWELKAALAEKEKNSNS